MLWTMSVVLIILWMLGLGTGFTMGSSIHILFAAAVALLVINLSQEVMINKELRRVLCGRPQTGSKKKDRAIHHVITNIQGGAVQSLKNNLIVK